ncbi:DUF2062 domain-containing protein [Luteolibacter sp. LG18]|uniref:DUF2062 domain-containing protein n=1 Tax=Luteolibacter sp. LG18 TaxID=2819286 RepID=UPI002B30B600|nr:hypothetical protein llg_07980 [Luteolibacter sp. LG18]
MTHPLFERRLWKPCRDTVATGLAVGMFFAVQPVPLQSIFAALIATRLRANVPFAMAACWLSNPVTAGPICLTQLGLGMFLQRTFNLPVPKGEIRWEALAKLSPKLASIPLGEFLLGCLASGVLLALLTYPLVHLFSALMPHHLPVRKYLAEPSGPSGVTGDPTKPIP